MPGPLKVLIVDDSATVRRVLSEVLARETGITVVGAAPDPYVAREMIVRVKPDVLTLDVEMPRMDGLSFLAKLMQHHPLPVVVISSLTPRGSDEAIRALELGAVEVLCKPGSAFSVAELGPILGRTLRAAASARLQSRVAPVQRPASAPPLLGRTTAKLLAIGASTGGTEAIATVLSHLPGDSPGTVIVQHLPAQFTTSFARRLNDLSAMTVAEARGGEELMTGLAFVAPGGHHLVVQRSGAKYFLALREGPQVHFQKPAVDVTFRTVAQAAAGNAIGVLLTGMGQDGAAGLKAMRDAGAHTIAQDEASCVVFGMPKAAIDCGAAVEVTALNAIPERIMLSLRRNDVHRQ